MEAGRVGVAAVDEAGCRVTGSVWVAVEEADEVLRLRCKPRGARATFAMTRAAAAGSEAAGVVRAP